MAASRRWLRLSYSRCAEPPAAGVGPAGIGESVGVESAVVVQGRQWTVLAAAFHAAFVPAGSSTAQWVQVSARRRARTFTTSVSASRSSPRRALAQRVWEGGAVPADDADVARMWHETANDTVGGMTQQEAHPR
jgi:hypothetical protein